MCVNMSSRQFVGADLIAEIEAILEETGLAPSSLKLEITESAFINDIPAAQATLERAQSLGIEWSLDDFGTGYSSLSHLHQLQVDTVKVDRSFVSRLEDGVRGFEMVQAIVTLAHNLGMDVVAEGVETSAQAEQLLALGCEYAQGFYFSKAVEAAEAACFIAAQPWREREVATA
jgi:EAL domain-containing protein (putative c-di-GMP-specific phosphodiesterase class I)